ncbi:conserved Plasmodium protein, unknown function [Plasmodium vinckei]|uniref:Thioredoxin domain-containing protein n=1 Tax=Plasmodium vinckei TaxID=5860 RepID=A0A6V7TB90_PLAVN|nr:conserved Plasmodium protein, unknown function [Plasmodium vinckei]
MKILIFVLFLIFIKNIVCEIRELSFHEFERMLTTKNYHQNKNYILENKINYKKSHAINDYLYLNTDNDFVLYLYAKWDADSNNLITVFREVARIIEEKNLKIPFYTFNVDNAKEFCNSINVTSLPLILYVSSVHKRKYDSLLQKTLNSSKDIKIGNAFRYGGDMYCYDYIVEWVEVHHYFSKALLFMKRIFMKRV